jgi:hypothetical protein
MARLIIEVQGESTSAELPRSGVLLVGSDPAKVGLLVTGQGVASVHCAIARAKGGGWALKDLGSEFGVQVNGQTLTSKRLAVGDVVLLGSRRLTVVDPTAEAAPASPKSQAPPAPPRPDENANRPALKASTTPLDAASGAASAPGGAVPKTIGGYRILRTLGRGGTGQVYLALQESLHRQVALKILDRSHEADREFVVRFQEEARAAAALSHPNVVTVYDVGAEGGHHYLSMEYMAGGDLEALLASEGPLPWRTLLAVLRDAASGLVFAESRGIVHRDIKPANLMRDDHGVVKIADLGLATQVEAEETSSEGRRLFGTPHFMAPEIVRGGRPDARSDLYSLGATAYRLLTGHTPFEGSSATEILRGALHGSFIPVAQRTPAAPAGLATLIESLLSREAAQRPASAQALLDAVERLRSGQDLQAGPAAPGAGAPAGSVPDAGLLRPIVTAAAAIAIITGAFIGGRRLGLWGASGEPVDVSQGAAEANTEPSAAGPQPGLPADPALDPAADESVSNESNAGDGPGKPDPVEPTVEPPPTDDDSQLKRFEEEARQAFLQLADRSLPDLERAAELRALAERFAGTDSAAAANEQARALEQQAAAASVATSEAASALDQALSTLRGAAALDQNPPQPATSLRAIADLESSAQFPTAHAFILRRNALLVEVIDQACTHGREQLRLADEAAQRGDFDARRVLLHDYITSADLPTAQTWPPATPTPGPLAVDLERLQAVAHGARLGLARIDYDRSVFAYERERRDRKTLAAVLGARRTLAGELRSLDLAAAATRLGTAAERLETPELAAHLSSLAADARAAAGCFEILAREFLDVGWRRTTIRDPRTKGGTTREALGAEASGLRVRLAEGTVESIPWSAYGARAKALDNLFNERLRREWSAGERHDIANLLTFCALGEALAGAEEMFHPEVGAHFTKGEAKALRAAFDYPASWARTTESRANMERERAAVAVLSDALSSMDGGAHARAVAGIERLLAEFSDSLLALALSDGSEWRDPAPDPRLLPPPDLPVDSTAGADLLAPPAGPGALGPAKAPADGG